MTKLNVKLHGKIIRKDIFPYATHLYASMSGGPNVAPEHYYNRFVTEYVAPMKTKV